MPFRKYDWEVLDKELMEFIKVDSVDSNAVNKFSCKYIIPKNSIYSRLRRLGIKLKYKGSKRGEKHNSWKGGRHISKEGYVMIYVGIVNGISRYIGEHILVMEKHIGRKLKRLERVHHIDESFKARSNNDIDNLQLVLHSEHMKHHHACNNFDPSSIEEVQL